MKNKITIITIIIILIALLPISFYLGINYSTSKSRIVSISSAYVADANTTTLSQKEISSNSLMSFQAMLDEEASIYATDKINAEFPDEKKDCKTIKYQQGINMCSYYKVSYFTNRLDKEYENIIASFSQDKISIDRVTIKDIKKRWIDLVNQECHLFLQNEGGTLQPLEENDCKINLLKNKILFIHSRLQ